MWDRDLTAAALFVETGEKKRPADVAGRRRGRGQSPDRDLRSVAVSFSCWRTRKSRRRTLTGFLCQVQVPGRVDLTRAAEAQPSSTHQPVVRWRRQVRSTGVWPLWTAEIYFSNILIIRRLIGEPFVLMDSLRNRSTQLWKKIDTSTVNVDGSERKKLFLQYRSHLELDFRSVSSNVLMVTRSIE